MIAELRSLQQHPVLTEPNLFGNREDGRVGPESLAWRERKLIPQVVPQQHMVRVMCRDEARQIELLKRFQGEGPDCKALLS